MATLARLNVRPPQVTVLYDDLVDVLHITRGGTPSAVEGEGLLNGSELTYALPGGELYGVTVLGYRRNG